MKPADKPHAYDVRFYKFLRGVIRVRTMTPREKYLHPLMDSVPFKDLETAILMAHMMHKATPYKTRLHSIIKNQQK